MCHHSNDNRFMIYPDTCFINTYVYSLIAHYWKPVSLTILPYFTISQFTESLSTDSDAQKKQMDEKNRQDKIVSLKDMVSKGSQSLISGKHLGAASLFGHSYGLLQELSATAVSMSSVCAATTMILYGEHH